VQHAIIHVVQPQIVEYICDHCGRVCGTRENPKSTWYQVNTVKQTGKDTHYCKKTDCVLLAREKRVRDKQNEKILESLANLGGTP
jgi:hypothetical protein